MRVRITCTIFANFYSTMFGYFHDFCLVIFTFVPYVSWSLLDRGSIVVVRSIELKGRSDDKPIWEYDTIYAKRYTSGIIYTDTRSNMNENQRQDTCKLKCEGTRGGMLHFQIVIGMIYNETGSRGHSNFT